ncbi:MAG TPA: Tad domain-containing protein, partial [Dongiaceae bacterium]
MFESKLAVLVTRCRRFAASDEASVLPMFTVAMLPLIALIGAAVDYSRASAVRTSLQSSLDSALLAGARDGSTSWTSTALNVFNGNLQSRGSSVASPTFGLTSTRAYAGSVSASVPTDFLGVLGISSINVNVSATAAVASTSGGYYCVLALNNSATAALQLTGNANITITAPKCVVQVNSNNSDAVDTTGNARLSSMENCFVGRVHSVGNSSVSPAPDAVCKAVPDPFVAYPRPPVGGCDFTNYSLSGNKTVTLQPGVYCGGMSFSGPVTVTFSPGLFVIKDGTITETGGNFTGDGVSFFLTGLGAGMNLSGQADWHIV